MVAEIKDRAYGQTKLFHSLHNFGDFGEPVWGQGDDDFVDINFPLHPFHDLLEGVNRRVVDRDGLTRKTYVAHDAAEGERSEEHTSELQSQSNLVCRLLL